MNVVFAYEYSLKSKGTPDKVKSAHFASTKVNEDNRVGISLLNDYSQSINSAITDESYDSRTKKTTSNVEANKRKIDNFINQLIEYRNEGYSIAFPESGIGQNLIGYQVDGLTPIAKTRTEPGKLTFMYLSQRLAQEFQYVNKNYPAQVNKVTTQMTRSEIKDLEFKMANESIPKTKKIIKTGDVEKTIFVQEIVVDNETYDKEVRYTSYSQLFNDYVNDKLAPEFKTSAYELLSQKGLEKYIMWDENQLSLFPETEIEPLIPGEIYSAGTILGRVSRATPKEVREQIVKCYTL
jgi:hypothetical protein